MERALIHSCQYQNKNDINTKITKQWKLHYQKVQNHYIPVMTSISVDVILGRVLVIEEDQELNLTVTKEKASSKVLLIRDRETKWTHSLLN